MQLHSTPGCSTLTGRRRRPKSKTLLGGLCPHGSDGTPKTPPPLWAVPAPKTPLFLVCQGTPPPIYIQSTLPPPPPGSPASTCIPYVSKFDAKGGGGGVASKRHNFNKNGNWSKIPSNTKVGGYKLMHLFNISWKSWSFKQIKVDSSEAWNYDNTDQIFQQRKRKL